MSHRYLLGYGIASLLIGIVFASLFISYRPQNDAYLADDSMVVQTPDGTSTEAPIPWYAVATHRGDFAAGQYHFTLQVELPPEEMRSPQLVLPFIAGSALQVKINDVLLGYRGDPIDGESTIWNAAHLFVVPPRLLSKTTTVEVEILGRYEAGILRTPYMVNRKTARGRLFWLQFFSHYLVLVLMGASALMGVITIGGSVAIPANRLPRILVGVGSILASIILMDYALIESLPISFLLFKKIVIGARHLAAAVLVAAAMGFLDRRRDILGWIFVVVQIVCVLAIFLMPGDVIALKRVYSITFFLFLPFLLYVLVLTALTVRSESRYGIVMFGILVAFATSGLDITSMAFRPDRPFTSHFGIVVLTVSAAAFVILDLLQHYKLLVREQDRSRLFFEASLHDQLTGLYNRRALPLIAGELGPEYSVLAIDLDNFKTVNDTYGHNTGDCALQGTAETIQENLRSGDYVVRLGGDEIVALLRGCSRDRAIQIAEQIEEGMRSTPISNRPDLYCTASIGVATVTLSGPGGYAELKDGLTRADEALYSAKRAGKARVVPAEPTI